jgi:hypothetical protein
MQLTELAPGTYRLISAGFAEAPADLGRVRALFLAAECSRLGVVGVIEEPSDGDAGVLAVLTLLDQRARLGRVLVGRLELAVPPLRPAYTVRVRRQRVEFATLRVRADGPGAAQRAAEDMLSTFSDDEWPWEEPTEAGYEIARVTREDPPADD